MVAGEDGGQVWPAQLAASHISPSDEDLSALSRQTRQSRLWGLTPPTSLYYLYTSDGLTQLHRGLTAGTISLYLWWTKYIEFKKIANWNQYVATCLTLYNLNSWSKWWLNIKCLQAEFKKVKSFNFWIFCKKEMFFQTKNFSQTSKKVDRKKNHKCIKMCLFKLYTQSGWSEWDFRLHVVLPEAKVQVKISLYWLLMRREFRKKIMINFSYFLFGCLFSL